MCKRHLFIDCDPGCDDALALFMALHSKKYQSITVLTVAGNVGINQTTSNALKILYLGTREENKISIKVYKGCAASLNGIRPCAASIHGRDGLGDVPARVFLNNSKDLLNFLNKIKSDKSAVQRYIKFFYEEHNFDVEYDLVCIGPLTNLASVLLQIGPDNYEKFWNLWNRIVIMCGALSVQGNISYASEFNAHADPLALKIVLDSIRNVSKSDNLKNGKPIFVTLDSTEEVNLRWEHLEKIDKNFKRQKLMISDN